MTTLRERIAAIVGEAVRGHRTCLVAADAILALFRDEAPPSDRELTQIYQDTYLKRAGEDHDSLVSDCLIPARRAVYDLGHARGYAKAEAERAELQRLLTAVAVDIRTLQDERDAARDELREVGEALVWFALDGIRITQGRVYYSGPGDAEYYVLHDGTAAGIIAALREAARKAKDRGAAT